MPPELSKALRDIKSRAEAATDGPWEAEYSAEAGHCVIPHDAEGTREAVARTGLWLAALDADFIAHARSDVPALISLIEQMNVERTALVTLLGHIAQACETSIELEYGVLNSGWLLNLIDNAQKEIS